jgi:hypothetical protein
MRCIRIWPSVAVVALVAASAVQAADAPAPGNSWTGFKAGSSVTLRMSIKTTPHVPEQTGEGELRMTLVSVDDEEFVVKSEKRSSDGEWTDDGEKTHSRKPEPDDAPKKTTPAQALPDEKIYVDGVAHVCKKSKAVSDGVTTITWVHKKHGELKSETTGPGDSKSTRTVTSLAKKVKIAGKEVTCREQKSLSTDERIETTIVT